MSKLVVYIYQVIYFLHKMKIPILPKVFNVIFVRLLFSCQIGLGAKLGKGTILSYGGLGIVLHNRVVIGKNVVIGQGVTVGGRSKAYEVPIIEDNCYISSGAKILGSVTIGKNSIVGANAVVIKDVPANSVVAGIPAKIIKENINIKGECKINCVNLKK